MISREDYVYKAKLSEHAERYEEMVDSMKRVAQMNDQLSMEERNLLSVAYKNVIGSKRASWRVLSGIREKEFARNAQQKLELSATYLQTVEAELRATCNDILQLIGEHLISEANSIEAKVFFYKMKGDYHRYMSEFTEEEERRAAAEHSLTAYKEATDMAEDNLPPTNPVRLGLALNFSVFYYEILGNAEKACALAKVSFERAIKELETLNQDTYKDSTLIMQLLRDNLTLWSANLIEEKEKTRDTTEDDTHTTTLETSETIDSLAQKFQENQISQKQLV